VAGVAENDDAGAAFFKSSGSGDVAGEGAGSAAGCGEANLVVGVYQVDGIGEGRAVGSVSANDICASAEVACDRAADGVRSVDHQRRSSASVAHLDGVVAGAEHAG